jgi:hypothetical protein
MKTSLSLEQAQEEQQVKLAQVTRLPREETEEDIVSRTSNQAVAPMTEILIEGKTETIGKEDRMDKKEGEVV